MPSSYSASQAFIQDKELAALLGGLSGYIQGRYNTPERKKEDEPDNPANSPPDA